MERQYFVLIRKRIYRHFINIFLKGKNGAADKRQVKFTTEHRVTEKDRSANARKVAAEYSTNDEVMYDALLRDSGYGKTFVLKGDDEGKLKRDPFDFTPVDITKSALANLFKQAGLDFDPEKSNEILEKEFQIYMNAQAGTNIKVNGPAPIEHTPVDLVKERQEQVESARLAYKEKYGEEIPSEFANDTALLDGLSNPEFDAKAYMEKASEETVEDVQKEYKEVLGINPPNNKKGDKPWMKAKIADKKAE
jgi:hypothetical protein